MERSLEMSLRKKLVLIAVVASVLALSIGGAAFAASTGSDTTNTTPTLSQHVTNHLVVLREQQKLARDLCTVFYTKYNVQAFHNIAASENRHMEAVKKILDRYGITDPVGTNGPGVFTNAKMQAKYNELVAKGGTSLADAYRVMIGMEKAEVALLTDIKGDTIRTDVLALVNNLIGAEYKQLSTWTHLAAK
jgi:hypothetical protein